MSEKALLENMHVLPKQLEIKNFETLMQANNIDLSDVEKNNICILEIFGADYAELYKTLIFAYKNKQLPIRQSIIGHCVRELVEGLLQWNDEESKAEVINALMKVSFINSGQNTQEDVKKAISFDKVWPNIKGLRRIEIGLKNLLRQRRPQLIEAIEQQNPEAENIWRNLEQIGDNVQNFYRKVQGVRHLNCRFNTIEESEIEQGIEHVNQYINNRNCSKC